MLVGVSGIPSEYDSAMTCIFGDGSSTSATITRPGQVRCKTPVFFALGDDRFPPASVRVVYPSVASRASRLVVSDPEALGDAATFVLDARKGSRDPLLVNSTTFGPDGGGISIRIASASLPPTHLVNSADFVPTCHLRIEGLPCEGESTQAMVSYVESDMEVKCMLPGLETIRSYCTPLMARAFSGFAAASLSVSFGGAPAWLGPQVAVTMLDVVQLHSLEPQTTVHQAGIDLFLRGNGFAGTDGVACQFELSAAATGEHGEQGPALRSDLVVLSPSLAKCRQPPSLAPGLFSVSLRTGTSEVSPGRSMQLRVLPHASVSSVSPASVSSRFSSPLLLRGSGLNQITGLRCTFGAYSSEITVLNASVATCPSPPMPDHAL